MSGKNQQCVEMQDAFNRSESKEVENPSSKSVEMQEVFNRSESQGQYRPNYNSSAGLTEHETSMDEAREVQAEKCLEWFKKTVTPEIKEEIEAKDQALTDYETIGRIQEMDDNKLEALTQQLAEARKKATTSQSHDSSIDTIVNLKNKIEALNEIKTEIEENVLPVAKKRLEEANRFLYQAAEAVISKLAVKERNALAKIHNNIIVKIVAHGQARRSFGRFIGLPPENSLSNEFELNFEGLVRSRVI